MTLVLILVLITETLVWSLPFPWWLLALAPAAAVCWLAYGPSRTGSR